MIDFKTYLKKYLDKNIILRVHDIETLLSAKLMKISRDYVLVVTSSQEYVIPIKKILFVKHKKEVKL